MTKRKGGTVDTDMDVNALVLSALREAYLEATEDVRAFAEKVRDFNKRRKAIREYLAALRECKTSAISSARERGIDLASVEKKDQAILAKIFEKCARAYDVGEVEFELSIPDRVPVAAVNSVALLDNEIALWYERLAEMGDAQLANIDLQNALLNQQRTMQMMSAISKSIHDAATVLIRKTGEKEVL